MRGNNLILISKKIKENHTFHKKKKSKKRKKIQRI